MSQALSGADLDTLANYRPNWPRPRSSGPLIRYRIALPDQHVVAHHTYTPPQAEPRVEVVVPGDTHHTTDTHVFLNGKPVTATITDLGASPHGDRRAVAAERAAHASPPPRT